MKNLLCSSIMNIKSAEYCRGGSGFSQGGANPKREGGTATYYSAKFSLKLDTNEVNSAK